ncbi:MAG: hypothetical protein B7Y26_04575 [Hydrogenophilales bacterium 16-64-46]|nr:MAG: hypothetical protein B7Z32_04615 [Hydrogenophilales bacterium 12-64-13]OYZ06249.1 MAG: hypothetical protein B7Y26_04575 [Hydrogenophilales bacterium 16-64-46]OZA38852.1 MAG: hypothetical protein B7X87_05315 [Hydrogenophilales bacterium 17-64-34]HQS99511.1 phage virion morphogenesis protein [Thiobacillus sp.]
MALLQIDIDDRAVLDVLAKLAKRAGNLAPALTQIGEELRDSTQRRFATGTGPDGQRWAPNSQTTLLRYLGSKDRPGGLFGKRDGKLTKKGVGAALGKKPLVDSGTLASTINYQLADGGRTLLVGSKAQEKLITMPSRTSTTKASNPSWTTNHRVLKTASKS